MKLSDNYLAVGAAKGDDGAPCVVLAISEMGTLRMPEPIARKLVDDILRNANYLWPVEEEST